MTVLSRPHDDASWTTRERGLARRAPRRARPARARGDRLPDARRTAAYDVRSGRADWAAGHIPGSAFADLIDDLSEPHDTLNFTFPSPGRFARRDVGARRRGRDRGRDLRPQRDDVGDAAVVAAARLRLRRRRGARRRLAAWAGELTDAPAPAARRELHAAPAPAHDRRPGRGRRRARVPAQRARAGRVPQPRASPAARTSPAATCSIRTPGASARRTSCASAWAPPARSAAGASSRTAAAAFPPRSTRSRSPCWGSRMWPSTTVRWESGSRIRRFRSSADKSARRHCRAKARLQVVPGIDPVHRAAWLYTV